MTVSDYLQTLKTNPSALEFQDFMDIIDAHYVFTPTGFTNGGLVNRADQNQGSCKVFSFARLHGLTAAQTLACFGQYYRQDVLQNPAGEDHQNIRNFMKTGPAGVTFDSDTSPLKPA